MARCYGPLLWPAPAALTHMSDLNDSRILHSWSANASPWTKAVRDDQIESRVLVTNAAIIEIVSDLRPKTVLDIGCGEGWLCRALADRDVDTVGVDAIPELVEKAAGAHPTGRYLVATYEEINSGALDVKVDVAVANFALIGGETVDELIATVPRLLNDDGALVIQTLHPLVACGESPYRDGWREGSWTGFSADFTQPAPWYFRTLETWVKLFDESGFRLTRLHEPVDPRTGRPASVIFVAAT
jgi:2-polyprenyl-3-methyl-5-hydroxy-6-metoxy-1,4-benzoquinol methylase